MSPQGRPKGEQASKRAARREEHSGRGRFITLEGIDGAGKSTHAGWIAQTLEARGHVVVPTREPGGTPIGEALRTLLLREPMTHDAETLLLFAARREHVEQVIRPALLRGHAVLCDRFTDATYAYQGGGHGVSRDWIHALAHAVHPDCNPDVTLLFDIPPEVSAQRLAQARAQGRTLDKFEEEAGGFFDRVRAAYLELARAEPARFHVIDASRPLAEVRARIGDVLAGL
jgi:dTMP kinase